MSTAYGREMALLGLGGSIPLCNVFAETYPDAELILMGVEEPSALIHAPNESVDPGEIARLAIRPPPSDEPVRVAARGPARAA